MVDFIVRNNLELLRVEYGEEECLAAPDYSQLAQLLDYVRSGTDVNHCVDCRARLPSDIEVDLYFIRVNDLDRGQFVGWLVQISSISDFDSFLLADTSVVHYHSRMNSTQIELLGCSERVNSCCIISHSQLLNWIDQQLTNRGPTPRYRWLDISLALSY